MGGPISFPLEKYLERIGLAKIPSCDVSGLQTIQLAQVQSIPFENIDPFLSRGVSLQSNLLYEKLLDRARGGYCFELNQLFSQALSAIGFSPVPILGRVFMGRPEGGPRTHLATLVKIEGRTWLADVGFGGPGLVQAVPFESGYEEIQLGRKIRLKKDAQWGMLYQENMDGIWRTLYALPEETTLPIDMEVGNHYCATHPQSVFTNSLYLSLPSDGVRTTVFNRSLRHVEGEVTREESISSEAAFSTLLRDTFRIRLSDSEASEIFRKLFPS